MDYKRNPSGPGWMVRYDDGSYQIFDTEAEARHAMALASEPTAEAVILAAIDRLLPVLRDAFKDLIALQNTWQVNDINATIMATIMAGTDVEDTPAKRLYALGVTFTELFDFLNRIIATIGITPNQALNRINWRNYELPAPPNAEPQKT